MKQALLSSFIVLCFFSDKLHAQTLTAACNPKWPDVFLFKNCDYLPPGPAGTNQTWNFSNAQAHSDRNFSCTFNHSSGVDQFGGNLAVMESSADGNITYAYSTDVSGISCPGVRIFGPPVHAAGYKNAETFMVYPFSYGASFIDSWNGTFTVNLSFTTYATFFRAGTVTVNADATGTLTTPAGTFTNVLRVHSVNNYYDSTTVAGAPSFTYRQTDSYRWYLPGQRFHIMSITTESSSVQPTKQVLSYRYDEALVGVDEQNKTAGLRVYPNPAAAHFGLELDVSLLRSETVIQDLTGKEVLRLNNETEKNQVNTSGLTPGVYIIRINRDGKTLRQQKLVLMQN